MKINAVLYGIALSMVLNASACYNTMLTAGKQAGKVEDRPAAIPVNPYVLNSIVQPVAHPVPVYLKSTPVKVQGGPQVLQKQPRYSPFKVDMYVDPQFGITPVQYPFIPVVPDYRSCQFYLWLAVFDSNPPFTCPPGKNGGMHKV
jgi:hypothetical protein